jgi:FkbM family methyltransferase
MGGWRCIYVRHSGPETTVIRRPRSGALDAAKRLLPVRLKNIVLYRRVFSDSASRRQFRAAISGRGPVTCVRLRALAGEPLWIRPGGMDPWVVWETFIYLDPLPPIDLAPGAVILDLGANIGTASALLAASFPEARIVAVEPDAANAALCERNLEPWRDRCDVVTAAAWPFDTTLILGGQSSATLSVRGDEPGNEVSAVSMGKLVDRCAGPDGVDFVKVDVEGAERAILSERTEWARRVRCISVEVHPPYNVDLCTADLKQLGFDVHLKFGAREPRVIGIRA